MMFLSRKRLLRKIPALIFFSAFLLWGCDPPQPTITIHFQTSTPISTQPPTSAPTETAVPDSLTPITPSSESTSTQIPELDFRWDFKKTRCNGEKILETSVELIITGGLEPYNIFPVGPLTISRSSPQITVTVRSATSSGEPSRTKIISLPDDLCKKSTESTSTQKEICSNGIDDDGDGLVDSADPDCPKPKEICTNGVDDDGDGLVDSADPDCPPQPEVCNNGIDDDRDGFADSADSDCPPPPETCNNGIDDDRDGLVDGNDPDCQKKACDDGLDNDGDGLIDWPADPGCKNKPDNDES